MKKIKFLSAVALCAAMCFTSCTKEASFDEALLVGTWQSGYEMETYAENHTGTAWVSDPDEDVQESEAQPFDWSLENAILTQFHKGEMGSVSPREFKIISLSPTTMVREDNYGKTETFTKAN